MTKVCVIGMGGEIGDLHNLMIEKGKLPNMKKILKPNGSVVLTTDSFNYPIEDELKEKHRRIAYVMSYYTLIMEGESYI